MHYHGNYDPDIFFDIPAKVLHRICHYLDPRALIAMHHVSPVSFRLAAYITGDPSVLHRIHRARQLRKHNRIWLELTFLVIWMRTGVFIYDAFAELREQILRWEWMPRQAPGPEHQDQQPEEVEDKEDQLLIQEDSTENSRNFPWSEDVGKDLEEELKELALDEELMEEDYFADAESGGAESDEVDEEVDKETEEEKAEGQQVGRHSDEDIEQDEEE
ncbi:MAG: hypothetical protein Q9227_006967 [Pyrenula ochraceoflavens]